MRTKAAYFRLSVVALATAVLAAACEPSKPAEPAPAPAPPPVAAPRPPIAPPPPLGRGELLAALDAAAAAYASGRPAEGETLAGRRFAVRQAFGCSGPAPPQPAERAGDGVARWSWGPRQRTIEIRLAPNDWTSSALIADSNGAWEAAEGVWLSWPWMRADGCPAPKVDPLSGPTGASPPVMGIAAVFEKGGSRLGRRMGRAYAFTVRGEGDGPPPLPIAGYRLVLEGRFVAFADGRAVRCRASGLEQRPVCVAAAQLDRVAFEAANGEVLSEWRAG